MRGYRTSKTVKSRQGYSNGHLPHCFIAKRARSMHDVACEFAYAVGMRRKIGANVLKRNRVAMMKKLYPVLSGNYLLEVVLKLNEGPYGRRRIIILKSSVLSDICSTSSSVP